MGSETICVCFLLLLRLAYILWNNVLRVYSCCCQRQDSLHFSRGMKLHWMHWIHLFFMYSPVPGHRGCFSGPVLLWAMQQWSGPCSYLLQILISFPWDVYPKVRWGCHKVVLFAVGGGSSALFSTMTAPFYMPTSSVERIQCFHILADTLPFLLLNNTV